LLRFFSPVHDNNMNSEKLSTIYGKHCERRRSKQGSLSPWETKVHWNWKLRRGWWSLTGKVAPGSGASASISAIAAWVLRRKQSSFAPRETITRPLYVDGVGCVLNEYILLPRMCDIHQFTNMGMNSADSEMLMLRLETWHLPLKKILARGLQDTESPECWTNFDPILIFSNCLFSQKYPLQNIYFVLPTGVSKKN